MWGDATFPLLDTATGVALPTTVHLRSISVLLPWNNHLYLGGSFSQADNLPRRGVVRLDPAGNLDRNWQIDVDGPVTCLASDGVFLYLGGSFTHLGGRAQAWLGRVRLLDGQPDAWAPNLQAPVTAIACAGGAILAAGQFVQAEEQDHPRLVRLDASTGKVDHDFTTGADAEIRCLIVDGKYLVIGGYFTRINEQDRHGLVRIEHANGIVDGNWKPAINGPVIALAVDGDRIAVGGNFTTVNNLPRANGALLDRASGRLLPTLLDADGAINSLAVKSSSTIVAAGDFFTVNGSTTGPVACLAGSDLAPVAEWTPPTLPPPAQAVAVHGPLVAVAADFFQGANQPGAALLDASGQALPDRLELGGSNQSVTSFYADAQYLYVGGRFAAAQGARRLSLARYLRSDLSLDRSWAHEVDGAIRVMCAHPLGLLIGGDFSTIDGHPAPWLGVITPNGSITIPPATVNGPIFAALPSHDGLVVAGAFTTLGSAPAIGIARLDAKLAPDPQFTAKLVASDGRPAVGYALLAQGERIVVGGDFQAIDGVAAQYLAWINPRMGTADPLNLQLDGPVYALATNDKNLLIAGGFTTIGGEARAHLANLDDKRTILPWRADADLDIYALAVVGNRLWVGGDFTQLAGHQALRLGCLSLVDGQPTPCVGANARIRALLNLQ